MGTITRGFANKVTADGVSSLDSTVITGATAETSIDGGDTILLFDDSASALRKMTRTNFVAGIVGTQPSFSATMSTNQNITNSTQTKVQFDTERFDTNSNYDSTTNFRFTPTVAGKYQINAGLGTNASTTNPAEIKITIFKNGSAYNSYDTKGYASGYQTPIISSILDLNGSTDYVEIFVVYVGANGGFIDTSSVRNWFDGSLIS